MKPHAAMNVCNTPSMMCLAAPMIARQAHLPAVGLLGRHGCSALTVTHPRQYKHSRSSGSASSEAKTVCFAAAVPALGQASASWRVWTALLVAAALGFWYVVWSKVLLLASQCSTELMLGKMCAVQVRADAHRQRAQRVWCCVAKQ
jgi:hypothetical protein